MNQTYDVIIIGGGATGAGIARDCSLRGIKALLLERSDISTGATGRNHGLLHSGARYAVTDHESAVECIRENMILRRIAAHCVEETDGLFITLPEDGLDYQARFVEACRKAGIRADVLDPEEARRLEPAANPALIGAVRVPDGAVDPFRLTSSNILDATAHGAEIRTYTEVRELIREQDRIVGVKAYDHRTHAEVEFRAQVVVNAGGIWGHGIAAKAGITVNMLPAKGALLIFGHRVNRMVLNRCRKPADADILVPGDTISLTVRVLKEDMTEIELQEGSETINESLTSVIESSPDDNNYKDESNLGEYGYKESTLEEEAGQADAQPEFTEMPFGDSDL